MRNKKERADTPRMSDLSYPELTRVLDGKRMKELQKKGKSGEAAYLPNASGETAPDDTPDFRTREPEAAPDFSRREPSAGNPPAGHRERLRSRFRQEGGFDHFQDHEILELLLTYGAPRRDVNGLAHRMLDEFGSLKSVLEARPEALMSVRDVGEAQATLISMVVSLTKVWERRAAEELRRITNRTELEKYCRGLLMGERTERFYVICVDAQCRVLGHRKISEGTLSEVSAYPRSVMETALNYNAHSVFFSHNHPGGTCAPSAEDIASTIQLQRMLNGVGILVLDHIIVAGAQTYSMSQHGDLDFRTRGRNAQP